MATLIDYKGLSIASPDPSGAGGVALNSNFRTIADTLESNAAAIGEKASAEELATISEAVATKADVSALTAHAADNDAHGLDDVKASVADVASYAASIDANTTTMVNAEATARGNADTAIIATLAGKAAAVHTHAAADISDSTATGRAIVKAADAAAVRTAAALAATDSPTFAGCTFTGGVTGAAATFGGVVSVNSLTSTNNVTAFGFYGTNYGPSGTNGTCNINIQARTTAGTQVSVATGSMSNASGEVIANRVAPTDATTSTGALIGHEVDMLGTGTGSGVKLLYRGRKAGIDRFTVDSAGNGVFAGSLTATGSSKITGKLGVGTGATTPAASLHVREGSPVFLLENPGVAGGYLRVTGSGCTMSVNTGYLSFETAASYPSGVGTERGRIAAAGNWLFGGTADDGVNRVQVSGGLSVSGNATVGGKLALGTVDTTVPGTNNREIGIASNGDYAGRMVRWFPEYIAWVSIDNIP
ncbi:MAG: hypothetical protein QM754_00640 [Tepidisphaeraceae bacterium]